MTEAIHAGIIVILFGMLVWEKRENKKERERFTNALIAKTPEQFRDLELTSKVKPITPEPQKPPDLVPEGDLTDDEFRSLMEKI